MQEAHIQIGLFLPSHQGRKQRYHQCENPQKPPPPRKQTQSHAPPLQSLRVGQYIIPLPPPYPSPVFQCVSRLGPVGEARLFCQNCLPCPPPSPSFTSAALGPGLQVLACLGKFRDKMSSTRRNQSGQKYLCLVQVTYLHYSPNIEVPGPQGGLSGPGRLLQPWGSGRADRPSWPGEESRSRIEHSIVACGGNDIF